MLGTNGHGRDSVLALGRKLLGARYGTRRQLYLIHSLTNRCNAQCGFCAWRFYDNKDELSTPEIKKLYAEAKAAGFIGVSLWGGEPLIHRDIAEICRYAHEIGLRTHMVTNGSLLMKKMDKVLPHLDRFCISVDHPSDRHDEMRGIPGLYGKIMDATREVRRRAPNKKVIYVYTFQAGNTAPETIRDMAEQMQELGVLGVFNAMRLEGATDDPEGKTALKQHEATQEELVTAFATVRQLKREGYPILNSFTHIDMMQKGPPKYRCHWPKFLLPIEANGDVVDCMNWGHHPVDNIRRTPLAQVLEHPRLRALAGEEGEACCKCVSLHRVEVSEACEGNMEPLLAWVSGLWQ